MEAPKRLAEVVGHDLIEVFTPVDGERRVWFLGHGQRDRSMDGGFSWLHYKHNIAPLSAILEDPTIDGEVSNYVYNGDRETELEDLDVFTLKYFYSNADTEEPTPYFEYRPDIPDGYYIMRGVVE